MAHKSAIAKSGSAKFKGVGRNRGVPQSMTECAMQNASRQLVPYVPAENVFK